MGQAIDYALGQWPALNTYLSDGRVEIDNNLVENAIRPTFSPVFLPPLVPGTAASAIGKKNWLFIPSAALRAPAATQEQANAERSSTASWRAAAVAGSTRIVT